MKFEAKNTIFLPWIVLVIAVIGVYSNHWENGFHFDDSHTIIDNMYIRDMGNFSLFFTDASTLTPLPINQSYRPVVTASYAIDYCIAGGLEPFYFHLSTFMWFFLTCALLFVLYRQIAGNLGSGIPIGSITLFGTAWFALHTVNAETINYISARSDVISTAMVLLAVVFYLQGGTLRKFHLYLIPLVFAVLTKPTGVMFAPLLFVYLWISEGLALAIKKAWLPVLVSAGLFAFVSFMTPETYSPGGTSVWDYAITQPYVIFRYFVAFFAPIHLSADTDLHVFTSLAEPRLWVGVTFIVLMLLVVYKTFRDKRTLPIAFGLLWFLIALAPTSSFVPLAEVMNDHRMFFPFVGLVIAVTWSMGLVWVRLTVAKVNSTVLRFAPPLIVVGILVANSMGVRARNEVWKTDESLWYDVTIKSPGNGRGLMNYGLTKMRTGEYEEALDYFERALEVYPYYTYLHLNMGILKSAMGNQQDAESYFKRAIELGPEYPEVFYYYGEWLGKQGKTEEAMNNLKHCLALGTGHAKARYLLMFNYHKLQEWDLLEELAIGTLDIWPDDDTALLYLRFSKERKSPLVLAREMSQKDPSVENYIDLSLAYYKTGQLDSCIIACKEAIKLNPGSKEAFNNICSAYNELREWELAIAACDEALKIDSTFQLARNNKLWAMNQHPFKTTNDNE